MVKASEVKQLQKIYEIGGNSIIHLYGTNRSDKESLVKTFLKDKKYFYYRGRNASPKEQLNQMIQQMEEEYQVKLAKHTFDECFKRVRSGDASKLVVVIDEFQLIAKKTPELFESLLKLKKKMLYPGPVMIVLCSSSIAWYHKDMADCLGDHFEAIDEHILVQEMSFLDIIRLFPEYTVKECVLVYGILGGVPEYLNEWNPKQTIVDNICNLILRRNGKLYHEAETYIGTELRELGVYDTILASLARGNEKLNDLYRDTGYSRAKISVYLKNLAAFDIAQKVVPFETGGWDNVKKGVYQIKNHYVNFWFTFVYPHLSNLVMTTPQEFYQQYIARNLDDYLRRYFVEVCQEYLFLLNQIHKVPIDIQKMGSWIGKTGIIDIIGEDFDRNHIVGICNWQEEMLTYAEYEELLLHMKQAKIDAQVIYLFSAKEFEEQLKKLAASDSHIVLVDMTEL